MNLFIAGAVFFSFTFLLSVSLLVGLVIGGVGSIPGCLVGGLFVLFVPNLAEAVSTGLAGAPTTWLYAGTGRRSAPCRRRAAAGPRQRTGC